MNRRSLLKTIGTIGVVGSIPVIAKASTRVYRIDFNKSADPNHFWNHPAPNIRALQGRTFMPEEIEGQALMIQIMLDGTRVTLPRDVFDPMPPLPHRDPPPIGSIIRSSQFGEEITSKVLDLIPMSAYNGQMYLRGEGDYLINMQVLKTTYRWLPVGHIHQITHACWALDGATLKEWALDGTTRQSRTPKKRFHIVSV
jgi:hypothetical protein